MATLVNVSDPIGDGGYDLSAGCFEVNVGDMVMNVLVKTDEAAGATIKWSSGQAVAGLEMDKFLDGMTKCRDLAEAISINGWEWAKEHAEEILEGDNVQV